MAQPCVEGYRSNNFASLSAMVATSGLITHFSEEFLLKAVHTSPVFAATLAAVIAGGGSRQAVAAAVAAGTRSSMLSVSEDADADRKEEVAARLRLVQPALSALVAGREPTGNQKAFRNVAMHADFGAGAGGLPKSAIEAKRQQRGGRKVREDPLLGRDPWQGASLPASVTTSPLPSLDA